MFLRRTKLLTLTEVSTNIEVSITSPIGYDSVYEPGYEPGQEYWNYEYYCYEPAVVTFTIKGNKVPNTIQFSVSAGYTYTFSTNQSQYWVNTDYIGNYTIQTYGNKVISMEISDTTNWRAAQPDYVPYSFKCSCYADPIISSGIKNTFTFSGDTYIISSDD